MSILLKDIIFDGKKQDIFIEDNKIKKISKRLDLRAKEKIDGKGEKAVLPGLINCHTHTAMTIFRGYADDLPLKAWLEKKIWPLERKLNKEDVYWGRKLAILEMIKTGTTCFNDMYWKEESSIYAVKELGIRAKIGLAMIDFMPGGGREDILKMWEIFKKEKSDLITFAIAPHSIYLVSKENLIWAKSFAKKNNLILHSHISETKKEVKDCQKKWKMKPVEYLERMGFLGSNVILAHGVWLSDKEIKILGKRKCSVVYNPCSNLKLAAGEIFPYKKLKEEKVNICLGTDGAASNNNLDMFEEMKIGSLIQKNKENDPTAAPANEVLNWATLNVARALRMNSGQIKEGKLADLILIDLDNISLVPGHNLISDVVYSASGSVVTDSICNGKILMRDGKVDGERAIIRKATAIAKNLVKRK
jgi:5-methylthioadenosine/S-adenosylhomocysteine deaminase